MLLAVSVVTCAVVIWSVLLWLLRSTNAFTWLFQTPKSHPTANGGRFVHGRTGAPLDRRARRRAQTHQPRAARRHRAGINGLTALLGNACQRKPNPRIAVEDPGGAEASRQYGRGSAPHYRPVVAANPGGTRTGRRHPQRSPRLEPEHGNES